MEKYVCIHGHFYQPPRENAWLEYVEMQDSAYPYHDWNERITNECYAPNAASRILDDEGYIRQITNNYARISFNFGPTLLSWLKDNSPETYQAILDADKVSQETFSGHGSAMAQAYNHMIMPLANSRDKHTQVLWGIKDFEYRFGRKPEGMWLPETAVDLETLDIMAESGLLFTILAPHQAKRVRRIGKNVWTDKETNPVDPTMAYELDLPSGRKIAVFFYDGRTSNEIAFSDLLRSGENFAKKLIDAFQPDKLHSQLINIASDGETYGHHHRFADMALAYAIDYIESRDLAKFTNYAEYLEHFPPTHQVEIIENTSWSCIHGIERWRSNCGCNAGRNPEWNQEWRAPLRNAFDWLRDTLVEKYQESASRLLKDPWAARDDYIQVILNRSPENISDFIHRNCDRELSDEETREMLKLLELQRHAMLMYTSCGWFFDELSGIETVQVIQYAGRAVQLAGELFGNDIENHFLERLELAKSNLRQHGDGRKIYEKYIRPAMVDITKVTTHFAVSSMFEDYGDRADIFCYHVDVKDYQTAECGRTRLAAGWADITSEITHDHAEKSFGVLHFGDHNINAGVRDYYGGNAYQSMVAEITQTCIIGDFPGVIRLLDKHFGMSTYSIKDLFRDEQRKVLDNILKSVMEEIDSAYYQVYEHHYPPMRFLHEIGYPIPKSFHIAAEFILNGGLRKAMGEETINTENIKNLLGEAQIWQADIDSEGLSYLLQKSLERLMNQLLENPPDVSLLTRLNEICSLFDILPFQVDIWKVQNYFNRLLENTYPEFKQKGELGDKMAAEWLEQFVLLGKKLSMRVEQVAE
jgi:alpha-amylase/alpha-mannosidase (GH57 family)